MESAKESARESATDAGNAFDLRGIELGVATAATQIEGGDAQTNWLDWAQRGRIKDGSSPARAIDHWNRVPQDTELLASLGLRHYRMGLEWARIQPAPDRFDHEAIDHYRGELDLLRSHGIRPLVTLHHFSNPMWFERARGFSQQGNVGAFLEYVRYTVTALADLVQVWITINEPNVYATRGYVFGDWPPGRISRPEGLAVMGVLARAHALAYGIIHEISPDATVTVAHPRGPFRRGRGAIWWGGRPRGCSTPCSTCAASRRCGRGTSRRRSIGPAMCRGAATTTRSGSSNYTRSVLAGRKDYLPAGVPVNDLGWEIYHEGLVLEARRLWEEYQAPIWITESGTCDRDDTFRSRYIYEDPRGLASSGLPVERYYHWTLADNWEWDEGYTARFGLIGNDPRTQSRWMKESGRFYAAVAAAGGVSEAMYDQYVAGQRYRVSSG